MSNQLNICSICHRQYRGYGHNAEPVNNGRCCAFCNAVVTEVRIMRLALEEVKRQAAGLQQMEEDLIKKATSNGGVASDQELQ